MEIKHKTSQNIKIVTKKQVTVRKVLNIYGVLTIIAMILGSFTNPIYVNEELGFYLNKKYILGPGEFKEFIIFLSGAAVVYFTFVNLSYSRRKKE